MAPLKGSVIATAFVAVLTLNQAAAEEQRAPKFYPDDPLWSEPPPRDVGKLFKRDIDAVYDLLDSTFGARARLKRASGARVKHCGRGAGQRLVHESPLEADDDIG
ncbi:MAG TPA: hypothetical protein VES20_17005 [Bryobacteraceae bacterium]|nr:hypothetical protein [Bryobacteraceae bacterium]